MKLLILLFLPLAVMADDLNEVDYVKKFCPEDRDEFILPDKTRVDCLTDYATEFDYCEKWAEGVGQALYYSAMTGKPPAITLICEPSEMRFMYRAKIACPQCKVETVPK